MAKKISQLTQATEVKSDDVTVIVQDGETKKLPLNMMVTKQDIENKKVAGLAKLDEIEATYENDTYTPTITVKNKSSVKVGEGDGVDYSANVMDGPAKSAILKGNTLVNLLNGDNIEQRLSSNTSAICGYDKETRTFHFITNLSHPYSYSYISTYNADKNGVARHLKNNTDYTIMWYGEKIRDDDDSQTFIKVGASSSAYGDPNYFTNVVNIKTGKMLYRTQTSYEDSIVRLLGIRVFNVSNDIEYKLRFVILEGDYTNFDIPYFDGMQSVKMPVLTTTTSQNLSSVPFSFFEKTTDRKYGAWTIFEFDNLFSGKIILNKRPFNTIMYFDTKENRLNIGTTVVKDVQFIGFYNSSTNIENNNKGNLLELLESGELDISLQENGKTNVYSYKKNDKTNILTVNEEVELGSVGEIKDELNWLTGELTQRTREVAYSNDMKISLYSPKENSFYLIFGDKLTSVERLIIADKIPHTPNWSSFINNPNLSCYSLANTYLYITIPSVGTVDEAKQYLSNLNPIFRYVLATESIKTVDLMPSGTHPSTTPYCWKNGHIQLSSSGLLPNLEYSVVTSRAGQINQNATMIVKNDKRIFDLEILLAGGLVNTTYQALTLQNQVETGLSKVSSSSETEPDYLLYHMIMKLIEEKAYKLDDLTEKVSVFYLYEKLSDEQFETIYSALYPFVEDEIVEEPVVEELPEVVEDEVIM